MTESEKINHPEHYKLIIKGVEIEAIDLIEALGANFNIGSFLKYIVRTDRKPDEIGDDDLKKARWYLDREIQRRTGYGNYNCPFCNQTVIFNEPHLCPANFTTANSGSYTTSVLHFLYTCPNCQQNYDPTGPTHVCYYQGSYGKTS